MSVTEQGTRRRQIVFTHGGGRFANQLMLFGHLIGLVEECPELSLCNFSFWQYSDCCEGTLGNPRCFYPAPLDTGQSLGNQAYRFLSRVAPGRVQRRMHDAVAGLVHLVATGRSISLGEQALDLADSRLREQFVRNTTTILAGWNLRDWDAFATHAETIRAFLRPPASYRDSARERVSMLRGKSPMVVGLLMRQTDYRLWRKGQYFLSSVDYRAVIDEIWVRFGADTQILLTSDQAQDESLFRHGRIAWGAGTYGRGHFLESFAEFGECDLVVSVPSTFAAWAAFLGKRPLLCLPGKGDQLHRERAMPESLIQARLHPLFQHAVY